MNEKEGLGRLIGEIDISVMDIITRNYAEKVKALLAKNGYDHANFYRLDDNTVEVYGCNLSEVISIFQLQA